MQRSHHVARAPLSRAARNEAARLRACIGCRGCTGICAALVELLSVPDAVLGTSRTAAHGGD